MVLERPALLQGGVRVLRDPPSQPSFFCSWTWELSARCSSRGQHVAVRFPSWAWEVWIGGGGLVWIFSRVAAKGQTDIQGAFPSCCFSLPGQHGVWLLSSEGLQAHSEQAE